MLVLENGDKGAEVGAWQEFLVSQGFALTVDNDFGPATEKATIAFQTASGLRPDALVGDATVVQATQRGFAGFPALPPAPVHVPTPDDPGTGRTTSTAGVAVIDKRGIAAIEQREGEKLVGYRDSRGLPTIGVGHLIKSGEPYHVGGAITQAECDRLLEMDLQEAEHAINSLVQVPLTQNQFDALVSFVINIGVGGFKGSATLHFLNAKNYNEAAQAMMHFVKPPEITNRRRSEVRQFLTSDTAS